MNALTLYEVANEYVEAAQKLADLDLPDDVVADTLEGMQVALQEKGVAVAMVIKNFEATAAAIKDAETKMASRRKALEARAERLNAYLLENMQRTGITKIDCPMFSLSVKKNPPKVIVDNQQELPATYIKLPDPPPPSVDKELLKSDLLAGKEINGAHIETEYRLEIK